ncbi:MAG: T9SS type A sorting domain-containing protein [Saprospiraceae bacterium]|nr:T9SS type A sorting domain-containing protein [Saprospiraceae bacterium]
MKNPLLTQFFSLVRDRGLKSLSTAIILMVLTVNVSLAQSVAITQQCYCLNNSTTPTNGQYEDVITLTALPGQTWRLASPIIGFYNPASLPPPVEPILYLHNTLIQEVSPGVFQITGRRKSGQGWSLNIVNNATGQIIPVASTENCAYPTFVISGDEDVCRNSTESYSIPAGTYSGLTWFLTGVGNNLVLPNGFSSIDADWGPTAGRYSIGVSGVHSSYPTQSLGCNFDISKIVDIEDFTSLTTIRGDAGNCIGATEIYTLDAALANLSGVSWTISTISGPVMTSPVPAAVGDNARRRTIVWPATAGEYDLTVSGNYVLLNGPGIADDNTCSFTNTMRINIVSQPTIALACNNLVQLSMNPSCELYFTPDQFLEAQVYPDHSYDIIIRDLTTGLIIPNGTLGYGYIGKTLEIKVVHECSGNSCWGYAKIEDKSIPELVCPEDVVIDCEDLENIDSTGFPEIPVDAILSPVVGNPNAWSVRNFDRCSDVLISFTDDVETDLCVGPYSSIITRTWLVTDNSGNSSSCSQTISINRASIDDVIFPVNWDSATGPNASLEACGSWTKIPVGQPYAGNPSPDYTGWPSGIQCLKAAVTFKDKKIALCGDSTKTYKLIRKWTVVDHCTGEIEEQNQLITVMDTEPPVVTCPADITSQVGLPIIPAAVIPVRPHSCLADWTVIAPIVISDCSQTTWDVSFLLADGNGKPPFNGVYVKKSGITEVATVSGSLRIRNLPAGKTWVRYTITDACGNFSYCFTEIDVIDNQPPTPVCDRNSIVAIGAESMALAGVLTFDDGSHDNCELACMKIRRMETPLVDWATLPCSNQIKFTCDDIGPNKTVMVELGVWDKAGLFNSCMVEAKVQDNIFPVLTIPADMTANCYEDFTTLTRFGAASATDNCTAMITEVRKDFLNECGLGTITRTFTATDAFGNKTTKTQTITVGNDKKFNGGAEFPVGDIDWPNTITLNAACITDITPDKLPDGSSRPKYLRNTQCAQLPQAHYEDIVFNFADNVCVKVLRKWTVIDWCQKIPGFPNTGEWTYTQLIMLNNTKAPDITKGCLPADLTITQVGECKANVSVTAVATDDCTPVDKLDWTYTIDENNDNTIEVSNGTGKTINRDFPYGTHKITWTVKDGCKNPKTCSNVFTIRDDKKPTPYCITELVTVIMPSAKEVTIWASDFDRGATDNCSVGAQITSSFSGTNRNDISRTIRCSDLGGLASKEISYNVYAIDAAGNSDFCTVTLVVQDNGNSCGSSIDEEENGRISLKGNIYNETDEMVQNVQIELKSNQTEFPKSVTTSADGKFSFGDLPMYKEYTLTADKNDDALNGVSTLDLVMIQRHILGITELDSPYKLIAADINNSEKITAADLVELRKLILGIQTEFSKNRSWRFVDVAHRFIDPKHPFPFIDYVHMNNLDHEVAGIDFVAVKIGDVNGSSKSNIHSGSETANRSVVTLLTENITAKAGDIVNVTLNAEEINQLIGMQMTLSFDHQMAELIEIKSDVLNLKDENLGFSHLSKGLVHLSWNQENAVNIANQIVKAKFKLLRDVTDKPLIALERSMMSPEIYTKEGNGIAINNIKLETGNRDHNPTDKFELYQNVPNPFNATTIIGFNLPAADVVTLKIFDVTGKMVYQNKGQFSKGYNTFNIDANALNLNGVMYYQIDTETDSATRKMIVIK